MPSPTIPLTQPLRSVRVTYYGPEPLGAREVEAREKAAYQKGYAEAEAVTRRQIVDARAQMKRLQDEVLAGVADRFEEFSAQFNAQMPDLLISIVRKIWAGLELDREGILRCIDATLAEQAPDGQDMDLSLSPRDAALLQDTEDFSTRYPGLRLHADKTLGSGDVVLRSRFGVVDGRIETKLRRVDSEIREVHE